MPDPGWYDDPSDSATRRFWDGAAWTTHTRPKDRGAPAQPSAAQMPPPVAGSGVAVASPVGGSGVAVASPPAVAPGPPIAAPAATSSSSTAFWLAGGIGVLVIFVGAAAFFLSGAGYSRADLETDLLASVAADLGYAYGLTVDCSAAPETLGPADTATCLVHEENSATATVAVTMIGAASFEWESIGSSIHGPLLAEQISAALSHDVGVPVDVTCPSFPESVPGATFTCTASDDYGTVVDVDATVTDRFAGVDWVLLAD